MATAVLWITDYEAMVFITVIDYIMKMKRNGVILLQLTPTTGLDLGWSTNSHYAIFFFFLMN